MDLGWIRGASGRDLGGFGDWIWGESGVDLGWIWNPAIIRHLPGYFQNTRTKPLAIQIRDSRAGPPSGHFLDPFFTTIRTLICCGTAVREKQFQEETVLGEKLF